MKQNDSFAHFNSTLQFIEKFLNYDVKNDYSMQSQVDSNLKFLTMLQKIRKQLILKSTEIEWSTSTTACKAEQESQLEAVSSKLVASEDRERSGTMKATGAIEEGNAAFRIPLWCKKSNGGMIII